MLNEEVIDVVAEEVTEQPTPTVFEHETEVSANVAEEEQAVPPQESFADLWAKHKKREYKHKQLQKRIKENEKALRGFGYEYKPLNLIDFYDADNSTKL